MTIRTDLAVEAHQLWREGAEETTTLPGVHAVTRLQRGLEVTTVTILDRQGQAALGKPPGQYVTVALHPERLRESGYHHRAARVVAAQLENLLQLQPGQSVLVVGLGNPDVTPDAVGPRVLAQLLVTRHLPELTAAMPSLRPVCALSPGVLGTTGLESAELVRGVVRRVRPDRVVVVDALAARAPGRICATVQLADTGIVPGSGVGNHRTAFNAQTLGVPVVALGVPTVVEARSLCLDLLAEAGAHPPAQLPEAGLLVTPGDIDAAIRRMAALVGAAINQALHPSLRPAQLQALAGG